MTVVIETEFGIVKFDPTDDNVDEDGNTWFRGPIVYSESPRFDAGDVMEAKASEMMDDDLYDDETGQYDEPPIREEQIDGAF
jgi:hypothetical protein